MMLGFCTCRPPFDSVAMMLMMLPDKRHANILGVMPESTIDVGDTFDVLLERIQTDEKKVV